MDAIVDPNICIYCQATQKNNKKTEFMDEGRVVDVSYLNVRNAVNSLSQCSYIQVGKL